jgi:PAS domain S-box-containing protein
MNDDFEKAAGQAEDARQAAVNLMEDAIQARRVMETLNLELRESERRFRELIDALPAAVYTTDAHGRLTHFNEACVELSGRTPQLGTDKWCVSWKLYYPDGRPMPHDECPMAISLREGRSVRGTEAIAERPDGTRVWFQPYPTPLYDKGGNVIGGVNMLVDITERKEAEIASAFRASVVESSDDAIITKNLDGMITSWNAAAERMFGYCAEEAIGRPITMLIPQDRLDEEPTIIDRLKRGERIEHFETRRVRKDGSLLDISLTISPVKSVDGRVIGASKIARDITERKRAEEALRDADRRKNEFLAMLAHELRNPLAPIRNALQIMRLEAGNPESVKFTSDLLERQVGQMVRLVDDLLDVSRISRGKIELRKGRVELASVVHHAVEAAQSLYKSLRHELTVTLPSETMVLHADPTRIAQIVGNLLNNACKFTDPGGRISLIVQREGPQAVIRVRDTGIGIADDQLPRIFEMFTQADTSLERVQSGLGIGLTLVKTLVEMHGGTVHAHSAGIGHGSEFVVRLPLSEDEGGKLKDIFEAHSVHPSSFIPYPSKRILVVDDNKDSATSLSMWLKMTGNEVETAYDGLEAMNSAATFNPHVVLLDIGLPKMNGYDVAREIRNQPNGSDIVLVALTGWGQDEDRKKSMEAGFNAHLVKPVDFDALEGVLARCAPAT